MSMYSYSNWHEIKDHVMIYHEDEWDDAEVVIWDPINRKHLRFVFGGSSRPAKDHDIFSGDEKTRGQIHFVAYPVEETWWDRVKISYRQWIFRISYKVKKWYKNIRNW